jgi:hypothetical protein
MNWVHANTPRNAKIAKSICRVLAIAGLPGFAGYF